MKFDKVRAKWERERSMRAAEAEQRRLAVKDKGPAVFERFGVRRAVIFGSTAIGASHSRSDIDLLVMPLEQRRYWEFRHALESALGYPLDLYTQADDPLLVNKIVERGDVVYDA
ncbi:MAG: nucleotidyltransferase domain-containing protein [Trueperaceae bacterium]